jgi:hypothetical protein
MSVLYANPDQRGCSTGGAPSSRAVTTAAARQSGWSLVSARRVVLKGCGAMRVVAGSTCGSVRALSLGLLARDPHVVSVFAYW